MTQRDIREQISQRLNQHTQHIYSAGEKTSALCYQIGFLSSLLAELCYRDSNNYYHWRRVIDRAEQQERAIRSRIPK